MKLSLRRFNPHQMIPRDGRIILVIGRRGSGKSTLIEDLMFQLHTRFDYGIGMAPTITSVETLQKHLPNALVFDEGFSKEQFKKMLDISQLLAGKHKLRNGLLIMDDCNADKEAFRSKDMRDVFMNGRHYGINILWAMHYCMDILPGLRSQVDYVFVLKDNVRKNKARLYENFFGMFPDIKEFIKVMDGCTENNEVLVLDNTSLNKDPSHCLYWYKAKKEQPPFTIGRPVFFKLSEYFANNNPPDEELLRVTIGRPGQPHPQHNQPQQSRGVVMCEDPKTTGSVDMIEKQEHEDYG